MGKKLFVLLSSLVALPFLGLSMEEPPITRVIYAHTAYTLPAGTWEVWGRVSLIPFSTPSISIAYGVRDWTQISTDLTSDVLGYPNVQTKFALGKIDTVPFAVFVYGTYGLAQARLWLGAGACVSIETETLSIHPWISFQLVPGFSGDGGVGLVYASSKDLFMLGELYIPSVHVRGGLLFRAAPSLDVRGWVGGPDFELMLSLTARF